jgi:cytochrome c
VTRVTPARRWLRRLTIMLAVTLGGCMAEESGPGSGGDVAPAVTGDPARGRTLTLQAGCGACHRIPGVPYAVGTSGPPLGDFARRAFIGGTVPNRPTERALFIRNAPALAPKTAMPAMPLSMGEAHDIAAFLMTLDGRR